MKPSIRNQLSNLTHKNIIRLDNATILTVTKRNVRENNNLVKPLSSWGGNQSTLFFHTCSKPKEKRIGKNLTSKRFNACGFSVSLNNNNENNPNNNNTEQQQPQIPFLLKLTPKQLHPYAYLARIDKPIGTMLLLYPCWWSIAIASGNATPKSQSITKPTTEIITNTTYPPTSSLLDTTTEMITASPDLKLMSLFAIGAFVMRGAGCTINDMWDKNYDKQVARTKTRPLANGNLILSNAVAFLGVQLALGLGVLLSLPNTVFCFKLGVLSLPLVVLYPTAKRWTNYPQLLLGMTFNWGALMGYAAVHGDIDMSIVVPMYLAGISWTIIYDTLYAHQDKKDDKKLGLKSTALTFGDHYTKPVLYSCVGLFSAGLGMSGLNAHLSLPFFASVGASTGHLMWQVYTADLGDPENLAVRFRSNQVVGSLITAGIIAGVMV